MIETARSPLQLSSRFGIVLCGVMATLIGLMLLAVSGAPMRFALVNAGALVTGLLLVAMLSRPVDRWFDALVTPTLVLGALLLLATAAFGTEVDGVSRWLQVGPLRLQPALILVPALLVAYAQRPTAGASAAMAATAIGLALQPDRSLASTLALGLLVVLVSRPARCFAIAFAAASVGAIAAFLQPDTVAQVEHVEGVVRAAVERGMVPAVLALSGTLVLLLPGLADRVGPSRRSAPLRVFLVAWLTLVLAALLGPYPTPLLGYGSSAVLGYLLCGLALHGPRPEPIS